jgi:hypothetical protein
MAQGQYPVYTPLLTFSLRVKMIYVSGDRVEYLFSHLPVLGIINQVGMVETNGKTKGMRSLSFRNSHV